MKRFSAVGVLAALIVLGSALLGAGAEGAGAPPAGSAGPAVVPAYSPPLPSKMIWLLPGQVLILDDVEFNACNAVTYGYRVNYGPFQAVDSKDNSDCEDGIDADGVTVGPFPYLALVDVGLRDDSCADFYYSTGNHTRIIWTSMTWQAVANLRGHLDITDSGFYCDETGARPPEEEGNLSLDFRRVWAP